MKSKFVLNKNSFNKFLGLTDDQMNQVKAGNGPGGPYYPTAHPTEKWGEADHNYSDEEDSCGDGYKWDPALGKCVPA